MPGFTLPGPRSPGFWSWAGDYSGDHTPPLAPYGAAGCRFPYGSPPHMRAVNLATDPHSPARVSKRTAGRRSTLEGLLPFPAPPASRRPVSGSISPPATDTFQLSVALLVRYRTRDVFRVGGWCPPASRGITNPRYSGTLPSPSPLTPTGLSPSTAPDFHRSSGSGRRVYNGECPAHTTSPHSFPWGFGLPSAGFGRPYSRHRMLLSFPPPTEMLHFGGFPLPGQRSIRTAARE